MNKLLTIAGIFLLGILIGMASAAILSTYYFPMLGSINTAKFDFYLDGTPYPNNTAIDWGMCDPDSTYSFENFTIVNTGSLTQTVVVKPVGLPVNWTLTFQGNNTLLAPTAKVSGWLNLTIPAEASTWPLWSMKVEGTD